MKPVHARLVLGAAMLGLLVAATGFERAPQLVGFSYRSPQAVAQGGQWQAGLSKSAGVNAGSFHAVSVVYKVSQTRRIQPVVHVAHETMAVASEPAQRQNADGAGDKVQQPVARSADGSARMVQTAAPVSGAWNGARTISDAVPAQPANVVTQWVMVTTWQNGQATRIVFTTASATGQETAADPGVTASEQAAPLEQGPRYAAVPVRGGWIVFQL